MLRHRLRLKFKQNGNGNFLTKPNQTIIPTGSLNWLFESFKIVNLISYFAVLCLESRLAAKTRVFKFL